MIFQSIALFVGTFSFFPGSEAAPHVIQPPNPLGNLGLNINNLELSVNTPLLDLSGGLSSANKYSEQDPSMKLTPQSLPPGLVDSPYSIDLPEGLKFNAVNDIVYEGYASLMRDYSTSCQEAIRRIDREFPNVKNCSDDNGLYFSQLDTICSDECLETTVTASKIIVEACNQEDSSGIVTDRSYASWSDYDTAKAACQPVDYYENKRCLEVIMEANVNRVNLKYKDNAKSKEYQDVLCLPCTEEFYLATREAGDIPSLYFSALDEPEELFKAFEKHCGYKIEDESGSDKSHPKDTEKADKLPASMKVKAEFHYDTKSVTNEAKE